MSEQIGSFWCSPLSKYRPKPRTQTYFGNLANDVDLKAKARYRPNPHAQFQLGASRDMNFAVPNPMAELRRGASCLVSRSQRDGLRFGEGGGVSERSAWYLGEDSRGSLAEPVVTKSLFGLKDSIRPDAVDAALQRLILG
jgi:hypothetical protein